MSGANNIVITGDGTADLSGGINTGFTGNFAVQAGFIAAESMADFGSASAWKPMAADAVEAAFDILSTELIGVGPGGATFNSNGFTVAIYATLGGLNGETAGGVTVMDSSSGGSGMVTLSPASGKLYQGGTTIDGACAAATDAVFGSGPINFGGGGLLKAIDDLAIGRTIGTPDDPNGEHTNGASRRHGIALGSARPSSSCCDVCGVLCGVPYPLRACRRRPFRRSRPLSLSVGCAWCWLWCVGSARAWRTVGALLVAVAVRWRHLCLAGGHARITSIT